MIMNEEFWVARDKNGWLALYVNKPYKHSDLWVAPFGDWFSLDGDLFPSVKWEDEEPKRVKINLI